MEPAPGTLYITATPLGNLQDFSPRAVHILRSVDFILAEDTRRAGRLFSEKDIKAQKLVSFFEHNEENRVDRVLEELEAGKSGALISDAGTPLLSDPGYTLVAACREAGFDVKPVPGPSAVTAALSCSGLPPYPFVFLGFLPRKGSDIRKLFESFAEVKATLVFFERKNRLPAVLVSAFEVFGPREYCIARELTKTHEEFILGILSEAFEPQSPILGEVTVIIGPPVECGATDEQELERLAAEECAKGGKPKEIVARVAGRSRGRSKKEIYHIVEAQRARRNEK